jgi:hypothetical protein
MGGPLLAGIRRLRLRPRSRDPVRNAAIALKMYGKVSASNNFISVPPTL